jgi:hypothetical protein
VRAFWLPVKEHAVNTRMCEAMKRSICDCTTPADARCSAPNLQLAVSLTVAEYLTQRLLTPSCPLEG